MDVCDIGYSTLILFMLTSCADLILNEIKQTAFSALIENDRMLLINAANN